MMQMSKYVIFEIMHYIKSLLRSKEYCTRNCMKTAFLNKQ